MSFTKPGFVLLAVVLSTTIGVFALGKVQPSAAADQTPVSGTAVGVPAGVPALPKVDDLKTAKMDAAKPAVGQRRDAVIKLPIGTFVKDMDAGQYGSGRLIWTFEDDKVFGTIEANVMGVEVELRTEAEISLSRSGTIYGIVTGVELSHIKIGAAAAGEMGEAGEYAKFAKLAAPLLNETLTDLPFSYQFRISGDKLTILNYRALLAGPNPLGKLGAMIDTDNGLAALSYFQALGVAVEGTYTTDEPELRDKPKAKPIIRKPMGK